MTTTPRPAGRFVRLFLACLFMFSLGQSASALTLSLSENELQERISSLAPLTLQRLDYVLTLENPVVDLGTRRDTIRFSARITATTPEGKKTSGIATLDGRPHYMPEESSFYVIALRVVSIDIPGIPQQWITPLSLGMQAALARTLAHTPIYTIKDESLAQKGLRAFLKSVSVEERRLVLNLEFF